MGILCQGILGNKHLMVSVSRTIGNPFSHSSPLWESWQHPKWFLTLHNPRCLPFQHEPSPLITAARKECQNIPHHQISAPHESDTRYCFSQPLGCLWSHDPSHMQGGESASVILMSTQEERKARYKMTLDASSQCKKQIFNQMH